MITEKTKKKQKLRNNEYYDIQGAYGYNGILSTSLDINLICNFTKTFNLFCVENNIVAEFLRLNPIINNLAKNRFDDIRVYDRDNVYVDLSMDLSGSLSRVCWPLHCNVYNNYYTIYTCNLL